MDGKKSPELWKIGGNDNKGGPVQSNIQGTRPQENKTFQLFNELATLKEQRVKQVEFGAETWQDVPHNMMWGFWT
jgi:hypothetical protein